MGRLAGKIGLFLTYPKQRAMYHSSCHCKSFTIYRLPSIVAVAFTLRHPACTESRLSTLRLTTSILSRTSKIDYLNRIVALLFAIILTALHVRMLCELHTIQLRIFGSLIKIFEIILALVSPYLTWRIAAFRVE